VLFSMPVTNPCTGAPGTLTAVAANEVFHVTFFTNGDEFWVTGTDEGTATVHARRPERRFCDGSLRSWFGESGNNQNDVQHDTNTFQLQEPTARTRSFMRPTTSAPTPTASSR
jgi:hypothetical protein